MKKDPKNMAMIKILIKSTATVSSEIAHPWVEEKINVLVKQGLVLLVSRTEVLQELVG